MRNHIDIVREGFTRPVKWQWTGRRPMEWEARFEIGPIAYDVSLFQGDKGVFTISFGSHEKAKGSMHGTLSATGNGNAYEVFSTVIEIVLQFDETYPGTITAYMIESDTTERSRHRVNVGIAKRIVSQLEHEYHIEDDPVEGIVRMVRVNDTREAED